MIEVATIGIGVKARILETVWMGVDVIRASAMRLGMKARAEEKC